MLRYAIEKMANIPKINHTEESNKRYEENIRGGNGEDFTLPNSNIGSSTNKVRQNIQFNQKSFRKRNQRQLDNCSNDINKVSFCFDYHSIVKVIHYK